MRKIHADRLDAKLGHPGEYRIGMITKHLHYIVNGALEVCEDCVTAKIKHIFLHKVVEEGYLKAGKMIYIGIRLQKKPSYVGSKNWILIKDSDTKQK